MLNALARRDVAIVSTRSGTTRDVIEVHLDLGGYPVVVADTAGLRETADDIEQEGIRRALERAARADIRLALFDAADWPQLDPTVLGLIDDDTLPILNKIDLHPLAEASLAGRPAHLLSLHSGAGLDTLLESLTAMVRDRLTAGNGPALTRQRHRQALEGCAQALARAQGAPLPELMTEDVRLAARALGRITGRVAVDELLDVIFRDFCIGK
ncbi:tRNA modification GTPase [Azospirillaceae bacterium]